MKKRWGILLTAVLTFAVLTSCSKPTPEEIQEAFFELLQKPATQENILDASAYLENNLKQIAGKNADHMVISLENYIFKYDSASLNYKEFAERYEAYISEPLQSLYRLKAEEQDNPPYVDAVLTFSFRQLCDRALVWETFVKENKDYPEIRDDALWYYSNYVNAILMGTTGTPVFSYQDGAFSAEAREAYRSFVEEYPDTAIADTLNEYFAYLASVNYRLDYQDATESAVFLETCNYLVSEAEKRALQ